MCLAGYSVNKSLKCKFGGTSVIFSCIHTTTTSTCQVNQVKGSTCVCCDINLIALFFYRVKNTKQIGDNLSKRIHLLLEKWRVRRHHRAWVWTNENAIKLSFCPLLIHHRIYLNKRLLSAHSSHTSCVFMPLGVIRCVGIPADASVLDCGVCHVVSTLEASQHQCGVVELNGKKNLGRCWLKQTKPQIIKTNLCQP